MGYHVRFLRIRGALAPAECLVVLPSACVTRVRRTHAIVSRSRASCERADTLATASDFGHPAQQELEGVRRLALHLRQHVRLHVKGDTDGGVAEYLVVDH